VRLRIAGDGMASVIEGAARSEIATFFACMPATLPQEAVAIGAAWTRAMEVPLSPATAGAPTGTLAATFHLDSLSRGGELAWISLRGVLDRTRTVRADLGGALMDIEGDMGGRFILDRRRGWITDARIEFNVRSLLSPPAGVTASPMRMRMKISQWMRVVPP
jgi:hypothetical protein